MAERDIEIHLMQTTHFLSLKIGRERVNVWCFNRCFLVPRRSPATLVLIVDEGGEDQLILLCSSVCYSNSVSTSVPLPEDRNSPLQL
jgi:hypothetical protein